MAFQGALPTVRSQAQKANSKDFFGPRMRYLIGTRVPAALLLTASLVAILRNDTGFLIGTVIGSVLTFYVFYNLVFFPNYLRLGWVLGTGLLLGYAFGSFNTTAQLMWRGIPLSSHSAQTGTELSIALAVALSVAAVLFFVGAIAERPLLGEPFQIGPQQLRLLWTGLGISCAALINGDVGLMGIQASESHHISVLGSMAGVISPILPSITLLVLSNARNSRQRMVLWLALAIEVLLLLPQGRRIVIYAMVVGFVAFNYQRSWEPGLRRPTFTRQLLILAAGISISYCAIVGFHALRYSAMQMGKGHSLTENADKAATLLREGDPEMAGQLAQNVQDRTFIITYLSELLSASWHITPMLGEDVEFCIRSSIPSVLYPNKHEVNEIGAEEMIANPHFGLVVTDEANSVLTAGVSDFGVVGAFAYPLVVLAFYICFSRFVIRQLPPMSRLFFNLALVDALFQAEVTVTSYINVCRDLLLFFLIYSLVSKIPTLRLGRRGAN